MQREEAKALLKTIRELSASDAAIEAFLKLSEVEARAEVVGIDATEEFIEEVIIDKSLLNLVGTLLVFQTRRINLLTAELETVHETWNASK